MGKKAYSYEIGTDRYMMLIWAESTTEAIKCAADRENAPHVITYLHREPWADKYSSEAEVPLEEYWKQGWSLTCYKCGKHSITPDNGKIVDGYVYCNECATQEKIDKMLKKVQVILEAGKGGK